MPALLTDVKYAAPASTRRPERLGPPSACVAATVADPAMTRFVFAGVN